MSKASRINESNSHLFARRAVLIHSRRGFRSGILTTLHNPFVKKKKKLKYYSLIKSKIENSLIRRGQKAINVFIVHQVPVLGSRPTWMTEGAPVTRDCPNKKKRRSPCPWCQHPDSIRPGVPAMGSSWPTRPTLP